MDFTTFDFVLLGVLALMVVIGLFRGFSGTLGVVAGFAAALAAGYFLVDAARQCVVAVGLGAQGGTLASGATAVVDFVFGLLAFGIVRWIVSKFVRALVPQPTDAILGALCGVATFGLVLAILVGAERLLPDDLNGILSTHSVLIRQAVALLTSGSPVS